MKRIVLTFLVVLLTALIANSQDITDEDRRDFEDSTPIKIDVDGDGRPDTIKPRIYQITPNSRIKGKRGIQNWIAFDLVTSGGKTIKSFFKYNYGTAEQGGSYWMYALKSIGDGDGDGTTDLIFYAGDDTSDETVWLANKGSRFVEFQRKTSTNDEW